AVADDVDVRASGCPHPVEQRCGAAWLRRKGGAGVFGAEDEAVGADGVDDAGAAPDGEQSFVLDAALSLPGPARVRRVEDGAAVAEDVDVARRRAPDAEEGHGGAAA